MTATASSLILNIWREVGAYLRYADAKLAFLLGVNIASLYYFITEYYMIVNATIESALKEIFLEQYDIYKIIILLLFTLSIFLVLLGLMPTLSKKQMRVGFTIDLWQAAFSKHSHIDKSIIYFSDIARFSNSTDYRHNFGAKSKLSDVEIQILDQVWVISRIAKSKFLLFNASTGLIVVAYLLLLAHIFWLG